MAQKPEIRPVTLDQMTNEELAAAIETAFAELGRRKNIKMSLLAQRCADNLREREEAFARGKQQESQA